MATFYVVCWYSANVDATLVIELSICLHGWTHNFAWLFLFLVAEMRSSSSLVLCDGSAFLIRSVVIRCDRIQPYTDHYSPSKRGWCWQCVPFLREDDSQISPQLLDTPSLCKSWTLRPHLSGLPSESEVINSDGGSGAGKRTLALSVAGGQ